MTKAGEHRGGAWQGMPRRGLVSLLASVCMGALVGLGSSGRWWGSVLEASLVGSACWLFVDGSRGVVSGWRWRRMGMPADQTSPAPDGTYRHWPGWPWVMWCVALGAGAGVLVGGGLARWAGGHLRDALGSTEFVPPASGHDGVNWVVALLGTLLMALAISYFFYSREQVALVQQDAEAARRLAAESQLRLLQAQLEPHMLFNTLANLRVLIGLDAPQAQHMLDRLIGFLRATLSASRKPSHTLAEEFERLGEYLALMQVRMGPRLRTQLQLPQALRDCSVPPLLLQPLIENAVRHGLEPKVDGGSLCVRAWAQGEQVCIQVQDDGLGLMDGDLPCVDLAALMAGGFGLQQVKDRLDVTWAGAASFRLEGRAGGGTLATLVLPHRVERAMTRA